MFVHVRICFRTVLVSFNWVVMQLTKIIFKRIVLKNINKIKLITNIIIALPETYNFSHDLIFGYLRKKYPKYKKISVKFTHKNNCKKINAILNNTFYT